MAPSAPVVIGPAAYAVWRSTELGALTERLEHEQLLRLTSAVEGARILDAGCGDGALALALAARGARVTGLDADEHMLAAGAARARAAGAAVHFVRGAIERPPFADGCFDTVVAVTVLCFIREPGRVLTEFRRVLAPGGVLVIGELSRWSLWAAVRRVKGWFGNDTWRSAHFRTASQLRRLAADAELAVASIEGAIFYPPASPVARILARWDQWCGRKTTFGAAFVVISARRLENGRSSKSF